MVSKARILGLAYDNTLPADIRTIYKFADEERRHLSTKELNRICETSTIDPAPILLLQERAAAIVTSVKKRLLAENPALIEPGGSLYPEIRAQACWRDCWHFLRVAIYALAAGRTSYTHPPGVDSLGDLYRELAVPIGSMACALRYLREEAVAVYASIGGNIDAWRLDQAIVHLEDMFRRFALTQPTGAHL